MLDFSKHFFILIYLVAFLQGVILLTLNQIYIVKTQDMSFKKLQFYNWAFWGHIAVNFIYFYTLYFLNWNPRNFILFSVNISLVVFVLSAVITVRGFGMVLSKTNQYFLIATGIIYPIGYLFTYKASIKYLQDSFRLGSMFLLLFCEIIFLCAIMVCCFQLFRQWMKDETYKQQKWLILFFIVGISSYAIFNFYVDICFSFFSEKTLVWGINIYNLTILFYITFNIVLLLLLYKKESFFSTVLGRAGDVSADGDASVGLKELSVTPVNGFTAGQYPLSKRETEVLALICQGKSNPDISRLLFISNNTVKHHVNNIFKKTGVKNRYELLCVIKKGAL